MLDISGVQRLDFVCPPLCIWKNWHVILLVSLVDLGPSSIKYRFILLDESVFFGVNLTYNILSCLWGCNCILELLAIG